VYAISKEARKQEKEKKKKEKKPDVSLRKTFLVNGENPDCSKKLFAGLNFKEGMIREIKGYRTPPWQGEAEIAVFSPQNGRGLWVGWAVFLFAGSLPAWVGKTWIFPQERDRASSSGAAISPPWRPKTPISFQCSEFVLTAKSLMKFFFREVKPQNMDFWGVKDGLREPWQGAGGAAAFPPLSLRCSQRTQSISRTGTRVEFCTRLKRCGKKGILLHYWQKKGWFSLEDKAFSGSGIPRVTRTAPMRFSPPQKREKTLSL